MRQESATRALPDLLVAASSGILLGLAFPGTGIRSLAWIALVPLFLVLRRTPGGWQAFFLCGAASCGFYTVVLWWSMSVEGLNLFKLALFNLYVSLYLGAFGLLSHHLRRKWPRGVLFAMPSLWVAQEYLKTHVGFLSFPFGLLGYSQDSVPAIAGIAAVTGVYGVSFLIVFCNVILSEAIAATFAGKKRTRSATAVSVPRQGAFPRVASLGVLILFFGVGVYAKVGVPKPGTVPTMKISLIQGNLFSNEKYDRNFEFLKKIYARYDSLSKLAAADKPDLIAWPSSSVPGRIPYDFLLVRMLSDLAQSTGAYLLVGTSGFDKFSPAMQRTRRAANSAFLFSPEGKILGQYDKARLLPFDEYLPLRDRLPWPSWIVDRKMRDQLPGTELTVFTAGGVRFGVQICWENMFPEQFRALAAKGIDFMSGMTNESFVHAPAAHAQMLQFYVFRAIENGIPIIRTAPTGVTCLIGSDGRISARVRDADGRETNVPGVLTTEVPLSRKRTVYTRIGDAFALACGLHILGLVLLPVRRDLTCPQERVSGVSTIHCGRAP